MCHEDMGKRIIVTGGLGFVGSHLCMRLLDEGHQVVCIDDMSTGQEANLRDLEFYPLFHFFCHDVTKPIVLSGNIDEIYNLACPASPVHYQKDPVKTTMTSIVGMYHILELARIKRSKVLQASTSEVYGNPAIHPQKESYFGNVNTLGIRSCYDEGKRCAESLCMDYHRMYGCRTKIIRIFNTYGPRMAKDDGRVISNVIMQALSGRDITIYGSGNQTRSFQYIDDLIEAMLRMMDTDDSFTGPVNIGNPHEITINQLAEEVIRITGSNAKLRFCELPADDPCRRCPDITLAHQNLNGWLPKIQLAEGLKQTINYFKQIYCHESKQH